jgi:hypothetical protein
MVGNRDPGRRERAQLIMIAAVVIAAFVLGSIVLLNLLHESPEFATERDGQSVTDAERVSAHLADDLHRFFLAHSSNQLLPYVEDESAFENDVAGYDEPYTNLSSEGRASITSVTYVGSPEGSIVWKNNTRQADPETGQNLDPDDEVYLEDATGVPRMYFFVDNASLANSATIVFEDTTSNDREEVFVIDHGTDTIRYPSNDTEICDTSPNFEIDITNGTGEVRSSDGYCRLDIRNSIDSYSEFDIKVEGGSEMQWEFIISGTDATVSTDYENASVVHDDAHYANNVYVAPTFAVTYQDASITYESEMKIFRRDQ